MQKISAYILAYNEAEKIADAVSSVLWADEIVVVDSGSSDRTAEIARSLGARVVQIHVPRLWRSAQSGSRAVPPSSGSSASIRTSAARRRCATRSCRFSSSARTHDAYLVPRRNYMMGRWIRGSGWYPNFRQPQLFRKGRMRYRNEPVHEGYELLPPDTLGQIALRDLAIPVPKPGGGHPENEPLLLAGRAAKLSEKRVSMGERSRTASGLSSSITCSSAAIATAGPVSSSRSEISRARSIATRNATSRHRNGRHQRARRCFDRRPQRSSRRMGKGACGI